MDKFVSKFLANRLSTYQININSKSRFMKGKIKCFKSITYDTLISLIGLLGHKKAPKLEELNFVYKSNPTFVIFT